MRERHEAQPGAQCLLLIGNLLQIRDLLQVEGRLRCASALSFHGPSLSPHELMSLFAGSVYVEAVIYLEVLGAPIAVLDTHQACIDRPRNIMGNVVLVSSCACRTLLRYYWLVYSERWKRYRRIAAQSFRKEVAPQFYPVQEREISRFLSNLLTRPEQFIEDFFLCVARCLQGAHKSKPSLVFT